MEILHLSTPCPVCGGTSEKFFAPEKRILFLQCCKCKFNVWPLNDSEGSEEKDYTEAWENLGKLGELIVQNDEIIKNTQNDVLRKGAIEAKRYYAEMQRNIAEAKARLNSKS